MFGSVVLNRSNAKIPVRVVHRIAVFVVNVLAFKFGLAVLTNHHSPCGIAFSTMLNLQGVAVVFPVLFLVIPVFHSATALSTCSGAGKLKVLVGASIACCSSNGNTIASF